MWVWILKPKQLAIVLDELEGFLRPKPSLEQWRTPGGIAAELAFLASPQGRSVVDLGTGTGILAIACKLMGARRVVGVENDREALEIAMRNAEKLGLEIEWINTDVLSWQPRESFDIAVLNPPFGSVKRHMDRQFVEKALEVAEEVFALLSSRARNFWLKNYNARILRTYSFPLPRQHWFHRRKREFMEVDLVYFAGNI